MSVEVGQRVRGDVERVCERDRDRDGRALLGSVEGAADQASAVTGDGRRMSVDCSKGVRMMEARNTKRRAPKPSIFEPRIRGTLLTCQRWPWLSARQMK